MSEIVIDCTELLQNPIRTGIQRVVRELLRHWPADGPKMHIARFDAGLGLQALPAQTICLLTDSDPATVKLSTDELIGRLRHSLIESEGAPLPANALVFIPELFYDPMRCLFHAKRLAEQPGTLAMLVYDFLPYVRPEIFRIRSAAPLMHYLRLTRIAPHVGYISEQTRQDHLQRVLRGQGTASGPVLPLGADGLGLERQTWSPTRRGYVALGSQDGRKNQHLIAAAFIELWQAGNDMELTLIGRAFEGLDLDWMAEARQFAQFRWLDRASDEEVRHALRSTRATIYASDTEGYGLPPVESLAAGIPVIAAASCPSVAMLESGGIVPLAPVTAGSIVAAVLSLENDIYAAALWAGSASAQVGSWREFAEAASTWLEGAAHVPSRQELEGGL